MLGLSTQKTAPTVSQGKEIIVEQTQFRQKNSPLIHNYQRAIRKSNVDYAVTSETVTAPPLPMVT